MTSKTVQILAATIVGLILLLLVTRSDDDSDAIVSGGRLLPDFEAVANDVTAVSISRSDESGNLQIRRDNDSWVVTERDDYPADIGKIRQLIIALADAEIVEEKTANPENYDRLGVADPDTGGSGAEIVVSGDGFSHSVILGDVAQGNFRYARATDNQTSYLVDQNPDLPTAVGDWLTGDLLDLTAARVRRVSISHAGGEMIVIEKSEEAQTDFAVLDIPDGRELSHASVANSIGGALTSLTLADARAATDDTPTTTVVFETWDGLTISAGIVAEGDNAWVAFSAHTAPVVSDEASEDTETTTVELPSVDEADEINSRLSGWQYQLAVYKKDMLVRRWDDILEPLESE